MSRPGPTSPVRGCMHEDEMHLWQVQTTLSMSIACNRAGTKGRASVLYLFVVENNQTPQLRLITIRREFSPPITPSLTTLSPKPRLVLIASTNTYTFSSTSIPSSSSSPLPLRERRRLQSAQSISARVWLLPPTHYAHIPLPGLVQLMSPPPSDLRQGPSTHTARTEGQFWPSPAPTLPSSRETPVRARDTPSRRVMHPRSSACESLPALFVDSPHPLPQPVSGRPELTLGLGPQRLYPGRVPHPAADPHRADGDGDPALALPQLVARLTRG
jgi:hypothetical protein